MPGKKTDKEKKKNRLLTLIADNEDRSEQERSAYVFKDDLNVRTFTSNTGKQKVRGPSDFHPEEMQIYEITQYLSTDIEQGLGRKQILSSYEQHGKNNVFPEYNRSFGDSLKAQLLGLAPVIYIFAGIIVFLFNGSIPYLVSSSVMLLLLIVNSFINVYASKCFGEVNKKAALRATVIRQGKIFTIDSRALVPGDIVLLQSGSVVPADIRLFESYSLYALETPITGAEESVLKDSSYIEKRHISQTSPNMVYAGTIIRSGKGTGIVCFTARDVLLRKKKTESRFGLLPDLIKYLSKLTHGASIFAYILSFVFIFVGLLFGRDIVTLFMAGTAISACSFFETANALSALSFGKKLKKALDCGAAVNNLNCISSLCDVNSLMCGKQSAFPVISAYVKTVCTADGEIDRKDADNKQLKELLSYAVLSSEIKRTLHKKGKKREMVYFGSDATMAIVDACKEVRLDIEEVILSNFKIGAEGSGATETYKVLLIHNGGHLFILKGSPEYVISYCTKYETGGEARDMDRVTKRALLKKAEAMTKDSQLVLAVGCCETNAESLSNPSLMHDLKFIGFIGIYMSYDIKSTSAVLKCASAGIETVLKTTDDYNTAVNMARNSSILQDTKSVISGEELEKIDYDYYKDNVLFYKLYLSPSADQWLKTLEIRKASGKSVLVTAESVDELKLMNAADVSTSLSNETNDTLRQSADVILQTGGINVISDLLQYAKSIYAGIHAMCAHAVSLFTTLISLFIIPIAFNFPFPVQADAVIPVVTVTFLLIMLPSAISEPSKNILSEKTEKFSKRFRLDEYTVPLIYGFTVAVMLTVLFFIGNGAGGEKVGHTVSYTALCVSLLLSGSMLSYRIPVTKRNNLSKKVFIPAALLAVAFNVIIMLIPASADVFGFAFPGAALLAASVITPAVVFALFQLILSFAKIDTLKGKREKQNKKQ